MDGLTHGQYRLYVTHLPPASREAVSGSDLISPAASAQMTSSIWFPWDQRPPRLWRSTSSPSTSHSSVSLQRKVMVSWTSSKHSTLTFELSPTHFSKGWEFPSLIFLSTDGKEVPASAESKTVYLLLGIIHLLGGKTFWSFFIRTDDCDCDVFFV